MKPRGTNMGAEQGGFRWERAEKTAEEEGSIGGGKALLKEWKERDSSGDSGWRGQEVRTQSSKIEGKTPVGQ